MIDCRSIARIIDETTRAKVVRLAEHGIKPAVVELIATTDGGVLSYSRTKAKKAGELGIAYRTLEFGQATTADEIAQGVRALNADPQVHGVMLGMPTFKHLPSDDLINLILGTKDIDGLGLANTYFVATNQERHGLAPATAIAAIRIAESITGLSGKRIVVLGRGRTVGRPVANMAINRDATVTVCHSRTKDLGGIVGASEIVISATGRAKMFDVDWLRAGQILIDCGISFEGGKTVGDFDSVAAEARGVQVTSVPGGVGVVTNAIIFDNLLRAMELQGIGNG